MADSPREVTVPAFAPPLALLVAGVMLILTAGNVMLMPLGDSIRPGQAGFLPGMTIMLACAGSIGAQAALLTILLTLGDAPLWQRLLWHWGLAAMAVAAWCLGYVMVEPIYWREFLTCLLALPLVSLACQGTLWLLRIYFRWRIEQHSVKLDAGGPPSQIPFRASAPERIGIRDFLSGTVLVAVTMAAARLGKPLRVGDGEYWGIMLGVSGAAAIVIIMAVLPVLYLLLGVTQVRWGVPIALALAAAYLAVFACVLILVPGGPSGIEKIVIPIALFSGFGGVLGGTFGLMRWYGYRLVRGA